MKATATRLEPKCKVLVIDDNPSIRMFLSVVLREQGYQLAEAATATEGIQQFRDTDPQVVILDLGLPDKDGLDILPEFTREDHASVIILTVRSEPEYREAAFAKGATAYLTKPFRIDDLLEEINRLA